MVIKGNWEKAWPSQGESRAPAMSTDAAAFWERFALNAAPVQDVWQRLVEDLAKAGGA